MPQTKKQKQENALKYWKSEVEKRIFHWGEDSYQMRYAKQQVAILSAKLGVK
jgi:hypothetical protein